MTDDILGTLDASKPSEEHRVKIREAMLGSTFAFGKFVCGFADLDPDVHARMARWIERDTRFKLGIAPRGFFKTSTWTLADTLRYSTKNPNSRTLLSNEIQDNAEKWVGLLQDVVMSPIYRWLFPEVVPDPLRAKWNAHQLELKRSANWPEATIEACGVGGASTSNHYDRQKNDDLVGKAARESALVMQKAIDHRKLSWSLMVNASESKIDDVGTRWGPHDVIDYVEKTVSNLDRYEVSIYRKDGSPTWPKRYPQEIIEQIRVEQGSVMFNLQYLNRVIGEGVSDFNTDLLRFYQLSENADGEQVIVLERENGPRAVRVCDTHRFQLIDAGLSPESHDARTANVVVALCPPIDNEPFDIVVLEAKASKSGPADVLTRAIETYDRWDPLWASIEVFGGHVTFFHWLQQNYPQMRLRKLPTDTRKSKDTRIREFYPYVEQRRVYVHRQTSADLVDEMASYPNGVTVDLLDALAYSPKVWIPPEAPTTKKRLPGVTDFDLADDLDEKDFIGEGGGEGRSRLCGY